jgi:hypothetical protein
MKRSKQLNDKFNLLSSRSEPFNDAVFASIKR